MAEVQKQIEGLPLEELEGQEGGFLPDRIEMRRRRRRRAGGGGAQFVTNTSESNSCAAAVIGCGVELGVDADIF